MSAPTPQRPLDGLMILVIDDHRDTVDMFREYLHDVGATVIGADSARAGLAFAETHVLDVVLVDLRMPDEDGHWFLRQLRGSRTARTAQVPVFAITGERHDLPADPASRTSAGRTSGNGARRKYSSISACSCSPSCRPSAAQL